MATFLLLPLTNSNFYCCPYILELSFYGISAIFCNYRHSSQTRLCVLCSPQTLFPQPLHTWRTLRSTSLGQRKHLDLVALLLEDPLSLMSIKPRVLKAQMVCLFRYLPFATHFWTCFSTRASSMFLKASGCTLPLLSACCALMSVIK